MSKANEFIGVIQQLIENVQKTQMKKILLAANRICETIEKEQVIHVFGTGHSQLVAEELFYRAGGLVPINPIFESSLSIQKDAVKSTWFERLEGYAGIILDGEDIREEDVIIIASHSGRNNVPVEMALEAKKRGLYVIAITALFFSKKTISRNCSAKKLYEIADLVLDNGGIAGDAVLSIDGFETNFGPTSSIINLLIVQSIVSEVISQSVRKGFKPEVWTSANVDSGDEQNKNYIEKYKYRIKSL